MNNQPCCANCFFGNLAPDRYTIKRKTNGNDEKPETSQPPPVWHCGINPPCYPSGAPVTNADARCHLFTEKDGEHNQPFRQLGANATTVAEVR